MLGYVSEPVLSEDRGGSTAVGQIPLQTQEADA